MKYHGWLEGELGSKIDDNAATLAASSINVPCRAAILLSSSPRHMPAQIETQSSTKDHIPDALFTVAFI